MKNIKSMMDNTNTNARATIGTPIPAIIAVFKDEDIWSVVLVLVVFVLVAVPVYE